MADHDNGPYIVIERRSGGLGGFFWGAVIGVGVALLLAPRSGRETRQEIQEGVERFKRTAEGSLKQMQDTLADTIQDARRQIDERIGQARDAMEAGREAARETRDQLERRIRETGAAPEGGSVASAEAPSSSDLTPQGDGEARA